MPRIDPLQLLRCLAVLLGPSGGILSKEQVSRLASLMTKFSKKLVSKCIYVLILKNTKTELISLFMSEGGWALTNSWLADAIEARNWPLMKELLELLLMCPVDVERLKLNNCPKLVKGLSKDTTDKDVQCLASRLVAQWLQVVKSPGSALPHPTIDTSHLSLEAHHTLDMVPQTQIQMLDEARDDGHFNFFPTDASMQIDINSELFCDPSDITFDTISKDDLLPASDSLCDYRGDASALIHSGISDVSNQIPSDVVSLSEFSDNIISAVSCNTVELPVNEVNSEVNEQAELMETDNIVLTKLTNGEPQEKLVLKLTLKDGKKVVKSPTKRKLSEDEDESSPAKRKLKEVSKEKRKLEKDRHDKEKDKSSHRHEKSERKSSSSSSSDRKSSKDSHRSESRLSDSRSKHHHSDKSKDKIREKEKEKSKSNSSKDKEKERLRLKEKEKEKSKLKEKEKAETQAEKDKATLAKIMQPSSAIKLGKIPKKTDSSKSGEKVHPPVLVESKKISISIENRKQAGEPRPKSVKTFPTKFRSTGLEEEVKPPPARKDVKKPVSSTGATLPATKDSSPLLALPILPEKRTKPVLNLGGPPDRPGAIKVIPAKPKSAGLQDSDFFMDALNAANTKREPRKRKRRTSGSKDDAPASPPAKEHGAAAGAADASPTASGTPPASPERPVVEAKPVFKFYQETLELNDEVKKEEKVDDEADEEDDEKDADEELKPKEEVKEEIKEEVKKEIKKEIKKEVKKESDEATEDDDEEEREAARNEKTPVSSPVIDTVEDESNVMMEREKNRLPRGVLVFHRPSNRPRKTLKWKTESELESVLYFELDETERVNVTKTSFLDMKQMERVNEREHFHMTRRISGEDQMKEHIVYSRLIPIDLVPSEVVPGFKSREKEIQFAREKTIIASPVFLKNMGCPDTPAEPDVISSFTPTDPIRIPLEDVTGPNSVNDFTNTPWPESKPLIIPQSPPHSHSHTISHQMPMPTPAPAHPGPLLPSPILAPTGYHSVGGDWRTGDGKVVIPDVGGIGMNPAMGGMGPMGPMGPGMEGMGPNMGMDMYNGPMGMEGNWNPDMNYGMMGGPGPDMYPMDQGNFEMYPGQGFGPGFRGRGRGWYRGGAGDSWRGGSSGRGRGGWSGPGMPMSKRVCRYFKRGHCATASCQFLHPPELKGRH